MRQPQGRGRTPTFDLLVVSGGAGVRQAHSESSTARQVWREGRARIIKPPTRSAALAVSVGLLLSGCEGGSPVPPTAPTLAASPSVWPDPGQRWVRTHWNPTQTPTSRSGPGICREASESIGTSAEWLMAIRRSGESIQLLYDVDGDPPDQIEYLGTVAAEGSFTANSPIWHGSAQCNGHSIAFRFEATLSGRLSPDVRSLTAKKVWRYQLPSGETSRLDFDWNAIQQ